MLLAPSQVHHSRFHWDPETRRFVGEASDLGRNFRLGRVYDDACDVGLTIVGRHSNLVFYMAQEIRDGEGDLMFTEFKVAPYQPKARGLEDIVLRIYND